MDVNLLLLFLSLDISIKKGLGPLDFKLMNYCVFYQN